MRRFGLSLDGSTKRKRAALAGLVLSLMMFAAPASAAVDDADAVTSAQVSWDTHTDSTTFGRSWS